METKFKKGDKVFCYQYGWGKVIRVYPDNNEFPILVNFPDVDEDISFTNNGEYDLNHKPTLSLTEYILKGFSQDRPEELPEKGQIVWVRDGKHQKWIINHFVGKRDNFYITTLYNPFKSNTMEFTEWFEMTTENPYKDE